MKARPPCPGAVFFSRCSAIALLALAAALCSVSQGQEIDFRRGDANADASTDIGDAVSVLFHLFVDGRDTA